MRKIQLLALCVAVACTKQNPNVCCNDQADCNAHGIPVGSVCDPGLVCRGNQCIAGTCASTTDIAYVDAAGSSASDCARVSPCTLARGLSLIPTRKYLLLASGTYHNPGTVSLTGDRWLIGSGATRPVVTNLGTGPVF